MEIRAHFSDIQKIIIDHLCKAQSEIVAAITWFTDRDIFEVLCRKAGSGVKVSIALIGDEINQGPGGLNFLRLEDCGGQVAILPTGSRGDATMRHKFCVIDRATVITGSYHWSRKSKTNDEHITVLIDSEDFAAKYLEAFYGLLHRAGQAPQTAPVMDSETVRRRLELIRSLVLLGERDEVGPHLRKLRPAMERPGMSELVAALDDGKYKNALEMIDDYLHRTTALIVASDAGIIHLRFELFDLEVRLESLSDEKAGLERQLIAFNRRQDEALGDLLQNLLQVRAEFARLAAEQERGGAAREQADAAARDAEQDYASYSRQHEELQNEVRLPRLDDDAELELKTLYRKACSLCHPDKFPEERKAAAHLVFTELQDAYKRNDLKKVREIHASLAAGGLPKARSSTLRIVDELKAAIAELEHAIASTLLELKVLHSSDAYKLMRSAGATDSSWQAFFERRRGMLEEELARFESRVLEAQCEGGRTRAEKEE